MSIQLRPDSHSRLRIRLSVSPKFGQFALHSITLKYVTNDKTSLLYTVVIEKLCEAACNGKKNKRKKIAHAVSKPVVRGNEGSVYIPRVVMSVSCIGEF